ncbi:hypothetical protein [Altererythrobacter sp. MF3-039]
MDHAAWIIFGIVLIALVARLLIGPSDPLPDEQDSQSGDLDPSD